MAAVLNKNKFTKKNSINEYLKLSELSELSYLKLGEI